MYETQYNPNHDQDDLIINEVIEKLKTLCDVENKLEETE